MIIVRKTLDLVKDSILCAIICAAIMILNAVAMLNSVITSMGVILFMGCYFQNKKIFRPILTAIIIVLVSFLTINPLYVLIFILPSVVLGVVSSEFLKRVKNQKSFLIVLTIIFFVINFIMELAFSKYIMNMDFITYVMSDPIVEIPEHIAAQTELFLIVYTIVIAAISFMEVLILQKGNVIYKKRIMKLIKEELPEENKPACSIENEKERC